MGGPRTTTFLYNIQKRQKLNSLKEKTNKVSVFMNTLGQSFKTFNRNINSESNPLMISNLTKISFKRSLLIRNKLKNIEKMNKEFDKEYSNAVNLNQDYQYHNREIKELNEEYEQRIKKEKIIRDANFQAESLKIFNILFKKNAESGNSLSNYKKNKKLNELKSSIDYICGVEEKGQNGNNKNDPDKVPHYTIQVKSPSFIREKTKNASFTPSVKYNRSKVYYNKKYELSQEKIDKSKKLFQRINKTVQTSPNEKRNYKIKGRNINCKTEEKENTSSKNNIIPPFKTINEQIICKDNSKSENSFFTENNINNKKIKNNDIMNYKLPEIKLKESDKNIFTTTPNLITFSPKQRHPILEQNLILPKKYSNSSMKEINKRCRTANNISHFKIDSKEKSDIILSKNKKFFPLLKGLLKDNYNLKKDLKLGFNIITNMINDFKKIPKKKQAKNELNIEKLRKELKLNNLGEVIDEIDVVMNNVKKMEKLVKKKDIYFLRKVAKTVIREDKLANKNLIFDNNNINNKLKKIYDRRKKPNNQDEVEVNLDKQERIEMIKLFKNDGPDFFSEDYLSNLIKRYKTLKVK